MARKEYTGFCADIWAMGVLLYALLCGNFPFRGQNDRDLYRKTPVVNPQGGSRERVLVQIRFRRHEDVEV